MRLLLLTLFIAVCATANCQKLYICDYSIGYRIGEGDAVGADHFSIASQLKKPAAFQQFIDTLDWNSMNGGPGLATYHRIFVQAELAFPQHVSKFWRRISIPFGVNFAFREKLGGMGIGYHYWYTRPATDLLESKMFRAEQRVQFIGLHTGLHRKLRIGKKVNLTTGILLQGEVAINHRYRQWVDSSAYSRAARRYMFQQTQVLTELKGRNFRQWSVLFPIAAEVNIYKNRWLIKPEITIGWQRNHYLVQQKISGESINAALWFLYRRPQ